MWAARQMSKPVESQINQMGGNDLFGRFTGVEPGLPGHANHAGEGLGVQVGVRDIEPVMVKVGGENPLVAALQTLALGAIAAALAYSAGTVLAGWLGVQL